MGLNPSIALENESSLNKFLCKEAIGHRQDGLMVCKMPMQSPFKVVKKIHLEIFISI